jgi:myosin protein heavy chain
VDGSSVRPDFAEQDFDPKSSPSADRLGEVKALQVKIVDLETQSYANSPVPGATKRLESKLREVQLKLDAEIEDRNEALRQKTIWERQSRDYQAQLKEMIQQQERLVQERGAYERAIGELQSSLKKAVSRSPVISTP